MRIAFDARPLLGPRTGVGVWLDGLVRRLVATTDWQLVACLPRHVGDIGLGDLAGRVRLLSPPVALPGTLWLHTLAAPEIKGEADVYIATLGILPRRVTVPSAVVVHDLTPLTRPRHHTLANRYCFNAYLAESVAAADAVVCVSETTRRRLGQHFPGAGRRAVVIANGVDAFFSPAPAGQNGEATRERYADGKAYIVQLGTLEPRKGIATLVAAHAALLRRRAEVPDLVLAGGQGWGGRWLEVALARHPEPQRVHVTGYVPRDDVRELLRHAEIVVLASEEEGFGLPLAEAMTCGAACVASDEPALLELAAGAADHFPRGDAAALAVMLERALSPDRRRVLRAAALARAVTLRWETPLAQWRSLLADLAGSCVDT